MDGNPNPATMLCPECGHEADSQGGSSYYICPCGNEFDRDEVNSDGTYIDEPDGWEQEEG